MRLNGFGTSAAPAGKFRHHHAVRIGRLAEAIDDLLRRFRVAHAGNTQRFRRALARVIVRRRADATETEDDIFRGEGAF